MRNTSLNEVVAFLASWKNIGNKVKTDKRFEHQNRELYLCVSYNWWLIWDKSDTQILIQNHHADKVIACTVPYAPSSLSVLHVSVKHFPKQVHAARVAHLIQNTSISPSVTTTKTQAIQQSLFSPPVNPRYTTRVLSTYSREKTGLSGVVFLATSSTI